MYEHTYASAHTRRYTHPNSTIPSSTNEGKKVRKIRTINPEIYRWLSSVKLKRDIEDKNWDFIVGVRGRYLLAV